MKRYMICLFLFVGVSAACLVAGYCVNQNKQNVSVSPTASSEKKTGEYYLVSEDGFLLVFGKDKETICLYTHIPLMDFPVREQERLREGIWFPDMMDVIHYLESYTS